MFKMLDKLEKHWEKSPWGHLFMLGEVVIFLYGTLYIFYLIAPTIQHLNYFLGFSRFEAAAIMWFSFELLCACIMVAWRIRNTFKTKKAEKKLKERQISDYLAKYQKYVDIVEQTLRQKEYEGVLLLDNWVKKFDQDLDQFARHRRSQERDFTDFEVVACLMYALTYKSDEDDSIVNVSFAFQCAKAFLYAQTFTNASVLKDMSLF